MSNMENIILLSDSYKISHYKQYPKGSRFVYSYFESRGGDLDYTIFFGLQYFLKKYLSGQVVTEQKIQEAKRLWDAHMGPGHFNEAGWRHILEKHGGKLPLKIKAVPEGMKIPCSNVLMTIENTDSECYWLTNYVETLLVQTWYPCSVAALSHSIKSIIRKFLEATGNPELLSFKLHDFGFRGVSSVESAGIGGAAHLINFLGSDTMASNIILEEYYDAKNIASFSIPAAEHSTITSWGKENEVKAFENMLDQYPSGLVAVVSDSFDIINACENLWGTQLKDKVMNRKGTLVVRPDSGDPATVVLQVLEALGSKFGTTTNEKGYKVLPDQVRVIQGDGVNKDSITEILMSMMNAGWSADNIAFGMGGALLQKLHRDTQKFAFKCSSIVVDTEQRDVYKDPVGDHGKKSKRGRLQLVRENGKFETINTNFLKPDCLVEVFCDGEVKRTYTLDEVRANSDG